MLAAYGVDVLDPKVTPRRIWSLARRLPAGAWPGEAMAASWSVEAHLLSGVMDLLAGLTWVTVRAYGGKMTKPQPHPRPGGRATTPARVGWGALARQLSTNPAVEVTVHE